MDNESRRQMEQVIDKQRDALVDDFANLIGMLNDRNYSDAALFMYQLGRALVLLSSNLATEALIRKVEDAGLDRPE